MSEPLLKNDCIGESVSQGTDIPDVDDVQSISSSNEVKSGASDDGQVGTTSMLTMTANWITAGLGVGILSLPWSAAGASIIPAAIIDAVVMLILAYTCVIVAESCEKHQVFDLGALLGRLPGRAGPAMEGLTNSTIWIGNFMCLIGYLIVVADSILPMLPTTLQSRPLLIVITSVACLPLCYIDQSYLAFTSWLAIAINVYLFVVVSYMSTSDPWEGAPACPLGFGKGIASMCNTLMMALTLQMFVPPMYESLERRSVARFRTVVYTSFGFLFVLFVGFQTAALHAFGPNVPQDMLASLPHNAAGNLVRYGMIGMVLGVYPLVVMPMVAPIRNLEWTSKSLANWVTFGIVVVSMFASFFVTQLGILNVINGAFMVLTLGTLAPALLGLQMQRSKLAMGLLVALGAVLFFCGFLLPDNYVEEIQSSCLLKLPQ